MSGATGAIIGGAVVSGVVADRASSRAASAARGASDSSISEQQRQFDLVRGDTQPYRDVGNAALLRLSDLFGLPRSTQAQTGGLTPAEQAELDTLIDQPEGNFRGGGVIRNQARLTELKNKANPEFLRIPQGFNGGGNGGNGQPLDAAAILESTPGYKFRLGESEKAIARMQSARGYSMAPRAAKEVGRYVSDYASGEFGNLVESMFRLSGLGGNAVNTSAGAGANAAANIGRAYTNQGNAEANAAMNSGAGWNNAIQGGLSNMAFLSAYNNRNQPYQPNFPYAPHME